MSGTLGTYLVVLQAHFLREIPLDLDVSKMPHNLLVQGIVEQRSELQKLMLSTRDLLCRQLVSGC